MDFLTAKYKLIWVNQSEISENYTNCPIYETFPMSKPEIIKKN